MALSDVLCLKFELNVCIIRYAICFVSDIEYVKNILWLVILNKYCIQHSYTLYIVHITQYTDELEFIHFHIFVSFVFCFSVAWFTNSIKYFHHFICSFFCGKGIIAISFSKNDSHSKLLKSKGSMDNLFINGNILEQRNCFDQIIWKLYT